MQQMDKMSVAEHPDINEASHAPSPRVFDGPNDTSTLPLDLEDSPKVRTKLRLYLILTALYVAEFLYALDSTIVSQSIPTICKELHSASGYVWIGSAYLLASAATGPLWAKCSDIWGRKLVFLVAIALFAAASVLAALSTTMAMLIAGRAVQGAASGGLVQLAVIIISDLFSVRKRSLYLGYSGFVWALAGAAGPLIGGAFTEAVSWRWCFWINVPLCGLTFGLSLLFLDVSNPRTTLMDGLKAIDWLGSLSILAVTTLVLVGLDFGGAIFPWNSPKVVCLIVFGTAMIGFFLFNEQRLAKYPLMPLGVFTSLSNNAVFIVTFAHGMVLIGIEFYMPLYLQSVHQASPIRSGIVLLPLIVGQAVIELSAGYMIHRTGRYREYIWAGSLLMTLGTGLYILLGANTTIAVIVGLEIVGALGPALLFQAPTIAIQNSVSQNETAAATASLIFMRSIAMSLSVVLGGVVFQNSMDAQQSSLAAAGLGASDLKALSGSQAAANVGIASSLPNDTQKHAVLQAFADSMKNIFILYACLAAVAATASAFIAHKKLNTEHTETKTGLQFLTRGKRTKS